METKMQLCPKCNGQGIVSKPPWIAGDVFEWSSTSSVFQCDVCRGGKIIPTMLIPDEPKADRWIIMSNSASIFKSKEEAEKRKANTDWENTHTVVKLAE